MWYDHCDSVLGGSALEVITRKRRAWLNPLDAVEDKWLLSCGYKTYGHGKLFQSYFRGFRILVPSGGWSGLKQLFRATGFAKINQSSKGYMLLIWGFLDREHVVIESLGNLASGCQCQSPNFIGAYQWLLKCRVSRVSINFVAQQAKLIDWLISCFVSQWPTQARTLQACKDACVSFTTFNRVRGDYERLQLQ